MDAVQGGILGKGFIRAKRHDFLFWPVIKLIPKSITPNHLSSLRILMTLPLILLMWLHFYKTAGVFFIFAGLLDVLDGSMARLRDQETELGAFLDPAADKLVNFSVFLGFLFYVKLDIYYILVLPIIVIDLMLFTVALAKFLVKDILPKKHLLKQYVAIEKTGANIWGKAKMITQIIILTLLLFFDPQTIIYSQTKFSLIPADITILHISLPVLCLYIWLCCKSLIGHLKVIKFKN